MRKKIKICSQFQCEKINYGLGYCLNHYRKFKKYGDPTFRKNNHGLYSNYLEAFESQIIKDDISGCWLWRGANSQNYGVISINSKKIRANRFSYEHYYGTFDNKLIVCHHCDNPACVNPIHLFLGSQSDNMKDCFKKGRHPVFLSMNRPCGEDSGPSKLKEKEVIDILNKIKNGFSDAFIGKQYNVHRGTILAIRKRKTWRHVSII